MAHVCFVEFVALGSSSRLRYFPPALGDAVYETAVGELANPMLPPARLIELLATGGRSVTSSPDPRGAAPAGELAVPVDRRGGRP
jgi:hypothetical protein